MMKEQLHSELTWFFKFTFVPIFLGITFLILATALRNPSSFTFFGARGALSRPQLIAFFSVFAIVGAAVGYRTCAPLKAVWLTDSHLIISNFRQRFRVPLELLDDVYVAGKSGQPLVRLVFKVETPFGKRIPFLAPESVSRTGAPNVVERISAAQRRAGQPANEADMRGTGS